MKDPNAYLFDFATAAMSVVLALLFDKVAKGISSLAGAECSALNAGVGLATNFAILLVLVSVLATLSFAHREMAVAYRRGYFILDLLTGALLLCIAVECAHRAAFEPAHLKRSMVVGLLALAFSFAFLVVRALLFWMHLTAEQRAIAYPAIFQVMGFHGLGILLTAGAIALLSAGYEVGSLPLLLCSLAAVFGALVYLSLFWVFRLKIRLESRDTPAPMVEMRSG